MREHNTFPVFGVQSESEPAIEPTDINWENRNMDKQRTKKVLILTIYLLIILSFNYGLQLFAIRMQKTALGKYMHDNSC